MKLLVTLFLVALATKAYSQLQCYVCDDCEEFDADKAFLKTCEPETPTTNIPPNVEEECEDDDPECVSNKTPIDEDCDDDDLECLNNKTPIDEDCDDDDPECPNNKTPIDEDCDDDDPECLNNKTPIDEDCDDDDPECLNNKTPIEEDCDDDDPECLNNKTPIDEDCDDDDPECLNNKTPIDEDCDDDDPECLNNKTPIDEDCDDDDPECLNNKTPIDEDCDDDDPECLNNKTPIDEDCDDDDPECLNNKTPIEEDCDDDDPECLNNKTPIDEDCDDDDPECPNNKTPIDEKCDDDDPECLNILSSAEKCKNGDVDCEPENVGGASEPCNVKGKDCLSGGDEGTDTKLIKKTKTLENVAPTVVDVANTLKNEQQLTDDELIKMVQLQSNNPRIIPRVFRRRRQATTEFRCYTVEVTDGDKAKVNRGCVEYQTSDEDTCTSIDGKKPNSCDLCSENECNSSSVIVSSLVALIASILITSRLL